MSTEMKGKPGKPHYHGHRQRLRNRFLTGGAAALQDYIQNASDESLADTPLGMLGPAWQVLLHIVNHGTDHRSQVLRALTDLGAPAFDQDFIIHQWFRK